MVVVYVTAVVGGTVAATVSVTVMRKVPAGATEGVVSVADPL